MASGSKIILVGGFHEMVELCRAAEVEIVGILDPALNGDYWGCRVLGRDEDAPGLSAKYGKVPVIVTPDDPQVRSRLVDYYRANGFSFSSLIHPAAAVSPSAKLGQGVVLQYGAYVSSSAEIGDFVKMNVRANVMHDVKVGACSTIAPEAVVLGRAVIGEACYIGANATILPGMVIGPRAVVGAGAVVTRAVAADTVVKGNPAR